MSVNELLRKRDKMLFEAAKQFLPTYMYFTCRVAGGKVTLDKCRQYVDKDISFKCWSDAESTFLSYTRLLTAEDIDRAVYLSENVNWKEAYAHILNSKISDDHGLCTEAELRRGLLACCWFAAVVKHHLLFVPDYLISTYMDTQYGTDSLAEQLTQVTFSYAEFAKITYNWTEKFYDPKILLENRQNKHCLLSSIDVSVRLRGKDMGHCFSILREWGAVRYHKAHRNLVIETPNRKYKFESITHTEPYSYIDMQLLFLIYISTLPLFYERSVANNVIPSYRHEDLPLGQYLSLGNNRVLEFSKVPMYRITDLGICVYGTDKVCQLSWYDKGMDPKEIVAKLRYAFGCGNTKEALRKFNLNKWMSYSDIMSGITEEE